MKYRIFAIIAAFAVLVSCKNVDKTRTVLLLEDSEYTLVKPAINALIDAELPFAMERVIRPDDSSEMKELLAKAIWKNNELAESISIPESINIIKVKPEDAESVIAKVKGEGLQVKTPHSWTKIVREEARKYSGKTYYVCADGNDAADGLTPETAWQSLDKVNNADLGFGDSILFKAGDVFRGSLEAMSGSPEAPITYGAYGEGEKPVIEPSYDASKAEDWEQVGDRLWKCVKDSQFELANVIFNHGEASCAYKEDKLEQLAGQDLHFTWVRDEKAVYMVSDVNPAQRYESIELAEKIHVINEADCHDVNYDGLWLRYGGAHGIGGSCVKRINIRNCSVSWIGGSTLYYDDEGRGVRYGNGIEFWSAAEDILIENCRIWECWDAGVTNQSNEDNIVQKNITVTGCEIWNCEYSYEYWQQGDNAKTVNVHFTNNVCRDAGKGWGHTRRWNPNAAHLMFYDTTAQTEGFYISGNRFENSEDCGIRLFNAWYTRITAENNEWIINENLLCRYHGRPTENLIYKYPDRLDSQHSDDINEIEGQTVEKPEVFAAGPEELKRFTQRFNL